MEILICGIPGSGNALLHDTIIDLIGLDPTGLDLPGSSKRERREVRPDGNSGETENTQPCRNANRSRSMHRFWELDQRVFLFVRRFLRRRNIHSPFLHRGGYLFHDGIPVLRSRHRISGSDFLFIRATLDHEPEERILSTYSIPSDLPDAPYRFCTMRNPEALIDACMNRVPPDMKHYAELNRVTNKDLFLAKWSDLDRFERLIRRICDFYGSYLDDRDRVRAVSYEKWIEDPQSVLRTLGEALGVEVGNRAQAGRGTKNRREPARIDRADLFGIRDFMTPAHLDLIEKHGMNDLAVEVGYDSRSCFTSDDISVRNLDGLRMELPEHLVSLDTMEERRDNNEVTIGNVNIRFRGPSLQPPDMARLARELQDYLSNYREDLEGRSVLLYGSGSLGEFVRERLENANGDSNEQTRIAGIIDGDDLSICNETQYDAIILCSIRHESAMEEKLMSARPLPGEKVLAWYDVI